mgnify:CR=1 FL=1
MSNPLMNMIGGMMGNNNPMQMVQQVMGMVRGSNNPQSMVESMAQTNPAIKQAMEMCKGKNPQEVFNSLCHVSYLSASFLFVAPTQVPLYSIPLS